MPVVVLAGGQAPEKLRLATGAEEKAFIRFGGKAMVFFVVEEFLKTPSIETVLVVGNAEKLSEISRDWKKPVHIVAEKGDILENFLSGCEVLGERNRVLASSCDIPLITSTMVEDFLQRCTDPEIDIYYPIAEKQLVLRRFPQAKRTFVHLQEGSYTGGNLILMNPAIARRLKKQVDNLIRLRKSPFRLASLLGWSFLIQYFLGKLSIKDVEEKIHQLTGVKGKVVEVPYAEIAMDLDKIGDFLLFEGLLTR